MTAAVAKPTKLRPGNLESRFCTTCSAIYLYPVYGGYRQCNQCKWGDKLDDH